MQIWKNLPNKRVAVTDWLHKFTLDVLGKHRIYCTISETQLSKSKEVIIFLPYLVFNINANSGDTVFGHDFNSLAGDGQDHFDSYNRIISHFSKPKNLILSLVRIFH